jgi:hypothetical protein
VAFSRSRPDSEKPEQQNANAFTFRVLTWRGWLLASYR